jgi:uncharacterized protein (TIGR03437 family)
MIISAANSGVRRALRLLLSGAGISVCALAQFSSLGTPRDGSFLLFSTSLQEKNTSEPAYGKIFRFDSSGLHLLYSRDIADRDKPCSNAYNLTDIGVSPDGSVLAVGGQCSCLNGNPFDTYNCVKMDRYTTTLVAGGQSHDYPGQFWLSRNGKLALDRVGTNIQFDPYACYVIDLGTGEIKASYGNVAGASYAFTLMGSTASATGRVVADNGTAVLIGGAGGATGLLILAGGTIQQIPLPSDQVQFADATIDASGQTILLTAHNLVANTNSLRIASPGVSTTGLLVADGYFPSMTDDGRQVLFLSARTGTPQAYLIAIDGTGGRSLTNEADGLAEAILSGDGTVAYALTLGGRLLKISVGSGMVQELIPRTPFLYLMFSSPTPFLGPSGPYLAPGKRVVLPGGGLSDGSSSAAPPLPVSLAGVSVSIQGRPAPILNVNPAGIDLLIPADATPNDYSAPLHLETTSPSPFAAQFDVVTAVLDSAPESVKTVHEDWSALVSDSNPARPGEILHTYALGLGATTPTVPFGKAAPSKEPLARVSPPPLCIDITNEYSSSYTSAPVELLFAGLAPEMVAVYQVDWRVPPAAGAYDHFSMLCPPYVGRGWGVVVPLAPGAALSRSAP